MKIGGLNNIHGIKLSPELEKVLDKSVQKPSEGFGEMLTDKLKEIDETQKVADQAVQDFATGKSKSLHEAVLALEMADTSLRLAVTVRNKVIEAYQEVMRMPI